MLTHAQTKTAYALLAQADAAFAAGDWPLASARLWDAFADTIGAIARQRGMPCANDADIRRILRELATPERNYHSLAAAFAVATRFRDAPARGGPEDYEVECFAPEMPLIIAEFADLG